MAHQVCLESREILVAVALAAHRSALSRNDAGGQGVV
jgi:hypothetical protein